MTTFAVTDLSQVLDATNYLLSNLGQSTGNGGGNVGNAVTINTQTGVIGQGGIVIGYYYQYLNIAYANSSDGASGFSINRFDNAQYYGVYNNAANPAPGLSNPANYQWQQVTGGLSTNKYVYYSTLGGRQISFVVATTLPGPGYVQAADGIPIDLDFVTNSASLPIIIATAYYNAANANIAPATPTGGTYDFGNLIFTAPAGWSNSIPANNVAFFSSQNTFEATGNGIGTVGPSFPWSAPVLTGKLGQDGTNGANGTNGVNGVSTYFYNVFQSGNTQPSSPSGGWYDFGNAVGTPPTSWSNTPSSANGAPIWAASAQVSSNVPTANISIGNSWSATFQYTGAGGAPGSRGPIPMGYVLTPSNPQTANSTQLSQWFQAGTGGNTAPVGTGLAPVDQDTAVFTFSSNTAVTRVATYYSANTSWANANGQVISGSVFVTGSVNANALNTNEVYTLTLKGGNAVVGNNQSGGFWANATTGDARFGGNLSIGNSLTIGNNANIGNSLTIGNSVTIAGVTLNGALVANIVGNTQLQPAAVGPGKIANNAVIAGTVANGAVTFGALAANSIQGNAIAANTLSGNVILANTLLGNTIIANTLSGNVIIANTINGNSIIANTINGNSIIANTISGNTIIANTIAGSTIIANSFLANTIGGNAIIANTLTADKIQANSITSTQISTAYLYTGNIRSFGAVQGDFTSPGYWLSYNSGDARLGGNVSIGGNLNVQGLITTNSLNSNTVITTTIQQNAVTLQGGISYFNSGTYATSPVAGQIYLVQDTFGGIAVTQNNQSNYVWAQLQSTVNASGMSAGEFFSFENYLLRYILGPGGVLSNETLIAYFSYFIVGVNTQTVTTPFVGFYDNNTVAGNTYIYILGSAWYPGSGTYSVNNFVAGPRSLVLQSLKR